MRNIIYRTVQLILEYIECIKSVRRDHQRLQQLFDNQVNSENGLNKN